jgi:hypothetical protein
VSTDSSGLFPALDELLASHDAAASLEFLIESFRASGDYGLLFEARLMKKRHELGLPLIQTDSVPDEIYQAAVVEAARESGRLFLAAGNIERAWPYFRAISETQPIADAIAQLEPREGLEGVIGIAFQEGVHPLKGLELIMAQHGMCRAITAFGMQAVTKDREKCIAFLATSIYREIVERMAPAVAQQEGEAQEGALPLSRTLPELMEGRPWLFGDWDYYVDTSHLNSVIPYCVEVTDPGVLAAMHDLCEYGKRLSPRFHSAGNPPFENQYEAYDHYIQALLGNDVEEHIDYFRRQVAECDAELAGDAPARTLVKLLVALNRPAAALDVLLRDVFEDAPYGVPVPSALQLCYQSKDFARMAELARDRGDLLSYAAGSIMSAS